MLTVNAASGFGSGGPPPVATITNTDDSVDASSASTYTFSSQALGTAGSTRKILIGVEV